MTIQELIAILEMQEEILQFSHFTNEDAWELGNMLVTEVKRRRIPAIVTIRLNNGLTIFKYTSNDRNPSHQEWIERKINTVKLLERSSFHTCMTLQKNEEDLKDWYLNSREYAACGGGFPVRVEEVGVIGTIAIAGIDHIADHDIIVKSLSRYLHIDEVPRIRGEI